MIAANAEPRELPLLEGDERPRRSTPAASRRPGRVPAAARRRQRRQEVGSVERAVTAWQMNGDALALGDLLLAPEPDARGDERSAPSVEPRVHNGSLVALAEAYTPAAWRGRRGRGAARSPEGRIGAAAGRGAARGARRQLAGSPRGAGSGRRRRDSAGQLPGAGELHRDRHGARGAHPAVPDRSPPRGDATASAVAARRRRPGGAAGGGARIAARRRRRTTCSTPTTTSALWAAAEQGRTPPVLAAIKTARGGQMTDGALEPRSRPAIRAWRPSCAGWICSPRPRSTRPPTSSRRRCASRAASPRPGRCSARACSSPTARSEAAGLLMSVPAASAPAFGRLAGEAWLRAGQPLGRHRAAGADARRRRPPMPAAPARSRSPTRLTGDASQGPAGPHALPERRRRQGRPGAGRRRLRHLSPPRRRHRRRDHRRRPHPGPHLGPRLRRDQGPARAAGGGVGGVPGDSEVRLERLAARG